MADMLAGLAPKSSWPARLALSNPWLLGGVTSAALRRDPHTAALVTTTTATTVLRAGHKSNVVPGVATATVNHRVAPGDSIEEVIARDRAAIDDPSVNITVTEQRLPTPLSPYGPSSAPFSLIATAATLCFPDAVTVPSTMLANTDSHWYLPLSRHVYRFLPLLVTPQDLAGIHGHDEAVSRANVRAAASFYRALLVHGSG